MRAGRALVWWVALATAGCIDAPSRRDDSKDAAPDGRDGAPDPEGQLLANADFDEGVGVGWIYQPGGSPRIATEETLEVTPHTGEWAAEVGGANGQNDVITQRVDVPEGTTSLTLSFQRCVLTTEPDEKAFDYCSVSSSVGDQEPVVLYQQSNTEADEICGWSEAAVAVTPFTAGEPIDIFLIGTNDAAGPTSCFYDTFELIAN